MKMNVCCVCWALGLVLLITISSEAQDVIAHPEHCCFNFVSMKIPANKIIKVDKLDGRCPKQGFVVTTEAGKKICFEKFPSSFGKR
ncbi:monocyte chemotactic protein 1B-like isoform X2 [Hoplias malabaricus]|uniref:monocyte chemotactic protein 1B-like isoform X2 n=1 Tax=Hoplias malabaricus TaxID=27720 RepID=UPI0034624229